MANWDSEIDEVARRLTDGEPGAGFKAQVLDRIEKADATRWPPRLVWTWPAVAGIAVLALAVARPAWKADWIRLKPNTLNTASDRGGSAAGGSLTNAAAQGRTAVAATSRSDASSATGSETSRTEPPDTVLGGSSVSQTASAASANLAGIASEVASRDRPRLATFRPRDANLETLDAIARADGLVSLAPTPIDIEPLRAAAMETPETIQVPGLDIAPLGVPRLAIARLEVPAMGDE